jgi:hypothetical protein
MLQPWAVKMDLLSKRFMPPVLRLRALAKLPSRHLFADDTSDRDNGLVAQTLSEIPVSRGRRRAIPK